MKIEFRVYHNPKPWVVYVRNTKRPERHKFMEAWQGKVGEAAAAAYEGNDVLKGVPLRIDTHFYLEPAKDAPRRKYEEWRQRRILERGRGNPDLDNLRKSTIDALQGVIIDDDCMVIAGAMSKQYIRDQGGAPYAHITIYAEEGLDVLSD